MTNEELAIAIQGGNKAVTPLLWEQTKLFIYRAANRYYRGMEVRCAAAGVTVEDLEQEGYLALLDAVSVYDGRFKLLTYINYPLLNRFNAMIGIRRRNPLNTAGSLDEPIPGSEDITIQDTIPDPGAEAAYLDAEERIFISQLRHDLEAAIDTLPNTEGVLVREKYFHDRKLKDIAEDINLSYSRCVALEHQAMRKLRRPNAKLNSYRDEIISRYAYRGSLNSFRHTHTSSTELAAMKLEGVRHCCRE